MSEPVSVQTDDDGDPRTRALKDRGVALSQKNWRWVYELRKKPLN